METCFELGAKDWCEELTLTMSAHRERGSNLGSLAYTHNECPPWAGFKPRFTSLHAQCSNKTALTYAIIETNRIDLVWKFLLLLRYYLPQSLKDNILSLLYHSCVWAQNQISNCLLIPVSVCAARLSYGGSRFKLPITFYVPTVYALNHRPQ